VSDIQSPRFLYLKHIIRRKEATSCEKAEIAEKRVILLTKKFGKLLREKGECGISVSVFPSAKTGIPTEQWLMDWESLTGKPNRKNEKKIAREALKQ
jgi:hypothetical protein